jgi:hypothetical protein
VSRFRGVLEGMDGWVYMNGVGAGIWGELRCRVKDEMMVQTRCCFVVVVDDEVLGRSIEA